MSLLQIKRDKGQTNLPLPGFGLDGVSSFAHPFVSSSNGLRLLNTVYNAGERFVKPIRNIVNPLDIKDLGEFANQIVIAASLPRHKRGGLNYVDVIGSAKVESDSRIRDTNYFRFSAEFMKSCKGEDNQFQSPCRFSIVGNYEGKFNRDSEILNNMQRIYYEVLQRNPALLMRFDEKRVLRVESPFHTLTK